MCQLSINDSIEVIYFAGKWRIRFAGSNLHKLTANRTIPAFVNQKIVNLLDLTDCKT